MTVAGAGAGAGFGGVLELSDSELASWPGLMIWLDPKNVASWTKVADPAITNGGFDSDTAWTKNTGWSIGSGVASHASGTTSSIFQAACTIGCRYTVSFTCLSADGAGLAGVVGTTVGTFSTATGARTLEATAASTTFGVRADSTCTGTADNVSGVCHSISAITPRAGSLTSAFSQGTATAQPWIDTTTGAIRFDGSADQLAYAGSAGDFKFLHYSGTETDNRPLFTVVSVASVALSGSDALVYSARPGLYLYTTTAGAIVSQVENDAGVIAAITSANGAISANTPFVHEVISTGGTPSLSQSVNGVAAGTPDTTWGAVSSGDPPSILLGYASGAAGNGTLGDIVIFDRVLSAVELLRLRAKLAKKWGITLP